MNFQFKRVSVLFLLMFVWSGSAFSSGFQNSVSTDVVGWVQLDPNVQYEQRLTNLLSFGAGLAADAQDWGAGFVLTPFVRYAPTGVLREGLQLQAGGYLPMRDDILLELGAGYSVWVDRVQLTPMLMWRHDQTWRAQVQVGWGWY
jgi:hypothetical protein